jgi:hypothetical protein
VNAAAGGLVQVARGRFAEAESAMLEAHAILKDADGTDARRTQEMAAHLAELYERWDEIEPDADRDADAASWRTRLDPSSVAGTSGSKPGNGTGGQQ